MGRNDLEDIAILVGLGIVGVLAYQKFFPGKSAEEIFKELDTGMRAFLDSIKLPALPELPQLQFPIAQPLPIQPAAAVPDIPITPTEPAAEPTNTVPEQNEPEVKEPKKKPPKEESGQVEKNPVVPPPPAGSGGAIVAFAGDFDSVSKAKQTVDIMEKNNVGFIVGLGDYAYSGPPGEAWFNQFVGARYKGKMKGAVGNHDEGKDNVWLTTFGQSEWNFAHQVAPNLTVVFIDTEKGITEAQLTSLTKSAKAQSKHVAYAMHKPYVTSSDAHHRGSENKWGAIIEKVARAYGVKLITAGHNHNYEHSTSGGIHYVLSGAAGRKFYPTGCKIPGAVKCVDNVNGFLKVAVGNSLLCQFITHQNSVYDSFTIA